MKAPNTIEELLRKKRADHILTMSLIKDICIRIKKLERFERKAEKVKSK